MPNGSGLDRRHLQFSHAGEVKWLLCIDAKDPPAIATLHYQRHDPKQANTELVAVPYRGRDHLVMKGAFYRNEEAKLRTCVSR